MRKPYSGSLASWPRKEKEEMYARTVSSLRDSKRLIDFAGAHRLIGGRPFSFAGHRYLEALYGDEASFMVIRKGAQLGASELAITRAIYECIAYGARVILYLATDHDMSEFSRDRFAPAIAESEYLTSLVRDTDTAGLKQIGGGRRLSAGTALAHPG